MFWVKDNEFQRHLSEFSALQKTVVDLSSELRALKSQISDINKIPSSHQSRLEDLEIWRKKIHDVLIEKTPSGKDKPTKIGREIGRRVI